MLDSEAVLLGVFDLHQGFIRAMLMVQGETHQSQMPHPGALYLPLIKTPANPNAVVSVSVTTGQQFGQHFVLFVLLFCGFILIHQGRLGREKT